MNKQLTQDYVALTGFSAFSNYSNQPYRLVLDSKFCEIFGKHSQCGSHKYLKEWGDVEGGVVADLNKEKVTSTNTFSIQLIQQNEGETFSYSGIDKPVIFEHYDRQTKQLSASFCYIEDNEIKPISKSSHPEIYCQMEEIYYLALSFKSEGLSAADAFTRINEEMRAKK